ncbi:heme exporter protein D [Thiogranum longum]|uniref:Heme exporter protein D n=1 Tax=Thiogranum longum TaxID=1537524 RepID=A0A4R1HDB2_9GAMM|nr:heme exporter protein CcmD [Thiogranum longum]TCK18603.1 heme exporter protein D [Thiogranum longum]
MNDFLHMGGYATYVWSSYGITLVVLLANLIAPVRGRRKLLTQLAQREKRAQRMKQ